MDIESEHPGQVGSWAHSSLPIRKLEIKPSLIQIYSILPNEESRLPNTKTRFFQLGGFQFRLAILKLLESWTIDEPFESSWSLESSWSSESSWSFESSWSLEFTWTSEFLNEWLFQRETCVSMNEWIFQEWIFERVTFWSSVFLYEWIFRSEFLNERLFGEVTSWEIDFLMLLSNRNKTKKRNNHSEWFLRGRDANVITLRDNARADGGKNGQETAGVEYVLYGARLSRYRRSASPIWTLKVRHDRRIFLNKHMHANFGLMLMEFAPHILSLESRWSDYPMRLGNSIC